MFTTLRKSSEACIGPSATNSAIWQIISGGRRAAKERRNTRANRGEFRRQPWHELELARELQSAMLPVCHPPEAAWDLAVRSTTAQTIGGDFYDFFRYPGKAICAEAIGDASGKGASAAIHAALVAGILRSLAPMELEPAEMLSRLNATLLTRPIPGRYVSMIYATWDERKRELRIANAGLPYPICVQNGKIFALQVAGLPLGLFESAEYEERTVTCQPGDLVVFYTDGITETVNRQDEEFGSDRLETVIATHSLEPAEQVVSSIFLAAGFHAGNLDPVDDQTVIAVRT